MAKTKEIVFHKPNPRNYAPPNPIPGIEQVLFVKLLGVFLQSDLVKHKHVEYMSYMQSTFTVLSDEEAGFTYATTPRYLWSNYTFTCSVLSAVQSWGGYALVSTENLQKLCVKAKRWWLVNVDYSLINMFANSDETLFIMQLNAVNNALTICLLLALRMLIECHCVHVNI